jgi:DNA-binding MarR family transcriptional regulator
MSASKTTRRSSAASATEAELEATSLLRSLYLLSAAERRLLRRQRNGLELTPGRLHLLVHLLEEGEKTNGQLARYADLTPATITLMLDKLVELDLVERRRDPDDRRVSWIALTPLGVAETTEARREWERRFADAFAGVDEDELDVARRILERVIGVYDSV